MIVYIQPMTGVVHLVERCSVNGRSRYGNEPVKMSDEVRGALDSGLYRWCEKCGA